MLPEVGLITEESHSKPERKIVEKKPKPPPIEPHFQTGNTNITHCSKSKKKVQF